MQEYEAYPDYPTSSSQSPQDPVIRSGRALDVATQPAVERAGPPAMEAEAGPLKYYGLGIGLGREHGTWRGRMNEEAGPFRRDQERGEVYDNGRY